MNKTSFYDLSAVDSDNNPIPFSNFQGKTVLIMNSAVHSDYAEIYFLLSRLYRKYHSEGFEILDFPCNQFSGQAEETSKEIHDTLREIYNIPFPTMEKAEVKGISIHPVFRFLTEKAKFKGFDKGDNMTPLLSIKAFKENPNWEKDNSIKWNFTYFLVNKDGKVSKRMECTIKPAKLQAAIEALLF